MQEYDGDFEKSKLHEINTDPVKKIKRSKKTLSQLWKGNGRLSIFVLLEKDDGAMD